METLYSPARHDWNPAGLPWMLGNVEAALKNHLLSDSSPKPAGALRRQGVLEVLFGVGFGGGEGGKHFFEDADYVGFSAKAWDSVLR